MTLADRLKMPLSRCMRETTERQYRTWLAWIDLQWDRPDRHDHYVMQLNADVVRGWCRHPKQVDGNQFRLKFKRTGDKREVTVEEATAAAKARALARAGMPPATVTQVPKPAETTDLPLG